MKPYFEDNLVAIYNKDARNMSELPNGSVQCVITSPPYWGLRKYSGLPDLIWGGNGDCEHQWGEQIIRKDRGAARGKTAQVGNQLREISGMETQQGNFCSLCGAWKGSYGLEPTPEMYIEHTIEFLREIRRVLRKDGVVFWNIGDSYAAGGGTQVVQTKNASHGLAGYRHKTPMMKPKDLCLIPFRVAIAAQEDGWWVRSVIIWSKPNPMPESVTDRPTESHEYILMLTKSARYYWDADAVRTPVLESSLKRDTYGYNKAFRGRYQVDWEKRDGLESDGSVQITNPAGRNIRTVWEFPTQPYPEAHFAVFPEKLPEICIKAATPEVGCCSKCGAPWERITKIIGKERVSWGVDQKARILGTPGEPAYRNITETLGWQPTCNCNADKVPSLVLDPFLGAGTTLWVAKKLNRRAVGYELSEEYCELALERNRQMVMGL